MGDIGVFVDESGEQGFLSDYYLLTLVFHEQDHELEPSLAPYRQSLFDAGLVDVPFHASPLLNRHDDYRLMTVETRKRYLYMFMTLCQHLPIRYRTFVYRKKAFPAMAQLESRIRRDIVNLLFEHLKYFQSFDKVKVYYDGGQPMVANALREAIGYALSKNAIVYRHGGPAEYRLAQAADFICAIELTACKYENGEQTATDGRFFGTKGSFRRNYLKKVRRLSLERRHGP